MASYKAGIKTRDRIIQTAKRLFYEKGYTAVSVTEICREAEIKLGTFTYHFKTKDHLIRCIYDSYLHTVTAYTAGILNTKDAAKLHIYSISLFYFNIYNDPNITTFQAEIYQHISMNDILSDLDSLYRCFVNPDDPALTEEHIYQNLITADNGCRRELNLKFMENHPRPRLDDVLDLVRDIYFVTGRLFSFSTDRLNDYITESRAFVLDHLDSNLRLIP